MNAIFSAILLVACLPACAQQDSIEVNTRVLKLGMTKQQVFRQFAVVAASDGSGKITSAREIPDDEMVIVCSSSEPGTCDGGEVQFHNGLLNYASRSWYSNGSAAETVAQFLGAMSRTVANGKSTSCTVQYGEDHEKNGMAERTFITCGKKGVFIGRFPLSDGTSQREGQDISEFIGTMTPERH